MQIKNNPNRSGYVHGSNLPLLMDQLNGNIHYQLSCDVMIDPMCPLTNYKLLDDVISNWHTA